MNVFLTLLKAGVTVLSFAEGASLKRPGPEKKEEEETR